MPVNGRGGAAKPPEMLPYRHFFRTVGFYGGELLISAKKSMRKTLVLVVVVLLSGWAGHLKAQNLENTSWKFYVEALHDTLTFHIVKDTSFCTMSGGQIVVKSAFSRIKDTLKIRDVAGEYACEGEGVYRYTIEDDRMSLFLITDPCDNRSGVLNGANWKKAVGK